MPEPPDSPRAQLAALLDLKAMLERLGQVHEIEGLMVEPLNALDAVLAARDQENAQRDQEVFVDLRAQLATATARVRELEEENARLVDHIVIEAERAEQAAARVAALREALMRFTDTARTVYIGSRMIQLDATMAPEKYEALRALLAPPPGAGT